MKVLMINGSPRADGNGNMAWMLAKIHANDNPDYPQHESEWQMMNFIR